MKKSDTVNEVIVLRHITDTHIRMRNVSFRVYHKTA